MKTTLEPEDIQAIAGKVVELIRPLLLSQNKTSDIVMDKKALSEYLQVDVSRIRIFTNYHISKWGSISDSSKHRLINGFRA